jgi:hypothetical protein
MGKEWLSAVAIALTLAAFLPYIGSFLRGAARHKVSGRTDYIIQNWLQNRNTIEFLGIWEQLNNPDFNPIEFDGIRKQAGLNSFIPPPNAGSRPPAPLA